MFVPEWHVLVDRGFSAGDRSFVNEGKATVDGRAAVALGDGRTTIYVSATGEPLPVKLAGADETGGVSFSDWGEAVDLDAPADALELTGVQRDVLGHAIGNWVPADE